MQCKKDVHVNVRRIWKRRAQSTLQWVFVSASRTIRNYHIDCVCRIHMDHCHLHRSLDYSSRREAYVFLSPTTKTQMKMSIYFPYIHLLTAMPFKTAFQHFVAIFLLVTHNRCILYSQYQQQVSFELFVFHLFVVVIELSSMHTCFSNPIKQKRKLPACE